MRHLSAAVSHTTESRTTMIGPPIIWDSESGPRGDDPRLAPTCELMAKLAAHHPRSYEHAVGSGNLAGRLAFYMELSTEQAVRAQLVAYLYGIGKLSIPAEHLDRPIRIVDKDVFKLRIFEQGEPLLASWIPTIIEDYRDAHATKPVGDGTGLRPLRNHPALPGMLARVADTFDATQRDTPWRERLHPDAAIMSLGYDVGLHPEITLHLARLLGNVHLFGELNITG